MLGATVLADADRPVMLPIRPSRGTRALPIRHPRQGTPA